MAEFNVGPSRGKESGGTKLTEAKRMEWMAKREGLNAYFSTPLTGGTAGRGEAAAAPGWRPMGEPFVLI